MSTPNPFNFPVVIGSEGLQPQQPTDLLAQLLAAVATTNPGYTANLPGSLVEDVSSTDVAAIALIDQAKVELVNSLTPNGANNFLLNQLGYIYGPTKGSVTNTSVLVVFSNGTPGFVIPNGFLVGDGTNVFQVQGGGIIGGGGSSSSLTAISVVPGSTFGVPANTVTTPLTSIPSGYSLTVNNPTLGTPGGPGETNYSYRSRVMQAGLAACVGTARFIKTLVGNVTGVQSNNLIAVQQASGIRVIVGGSASTYNIAYAIFCAIADPASLVGSGVSSLRNVTVTLYDYPNTYTIVYVSPPVQTVTMTVTWNTSLTSFTGGAAFPSLVQSPLVAYINSIAIGLPINVLEMNEIFQQAVSTVLDPTVLTRLVFAVSINGTPTSPGSGTYAVSGDPEGYFTAVSSGITVVQG